MPNNPSVVPIWTREDAAILAALAAAHPTYPAEAPRWHMYVPAPPKPGMRPRRLRRLIWLAALGAVIAGALAGTGIAKAEPQTVGEYADLNATFICSMLDSDPTGPDDVAEALLARGINGTQAGQVMYLAVHEHCARNEPALMKWATNDPTVTLAFKL